MEKSGRAKIFMHGRSQAVRLPKEFRLPGKEVRVTHVGNGVLLEPINPKTMSVKEWFALLDSYQDVPFLPDGRPEQPLMPPDQPLFDDEPEE